MNGSLLTKAAAGLILTGIAGAYGWIWSTTNTVTSTEATQQSIITRLDRIEDKLDRLIERQ